LNDGRAHQVFQVASDVFDPNRRLLIAIVPRLSVPQDVLRPVVADHVQQLSVLTSDNFDQRFPNQQGEVVAVVERP
jgi:hypothetical protein